jgi:hypothetical protein
MDGSCYLERLADYGTTGEVISRLTVADSVILYPADSLVSGMPIRPGRGDVCGTGGRQPNPGPVILNRPSKLHMSVVRRPLESPPEWKPSSEDIQSPP